MGTPSAAANATTPTGSTTQALRRVVLITWGALMLASLVWGVSWDLFADKGLGAEISAGATREGSTFVTVSNNSPNPWQDVLVELDGVWVVGFAQMDAGESRDVPVRNFSNIHRIPRPHNLYFWEATGVEREAERAPSTLRPRQIRVRADRGEKRVEVGF